MKIVGLRIEKYVGETVMQTNGVFEYSPAEFERHIICAILENSTKQKVEITLNYSEGECGSGWTTATFGWLEFKSVERFSGFTHIPTKLLFVPDINGKETDVENEVFSFSQFGGDEYYPGGGYYVDMDLFRPTIRHKTKRPVWVFVGPSNSGKSFLSGKLGVDLDVYETDLSDKLPDVITANVVVLGNKYNFTIGDIKSKLFGEPEIIIVNFQIL